MKKILALSAAVCAFASCSADSVESEEIPLVIEGWIDSGGAPFVSVTEGLPATGLITVEKYISECIVIDAEVTVNDGDRDYVLHPELDPNHIPPYLFTSDAFEGEPGKTYTLTVISDGRTVTAATSIPRPADIDRFITELSDKGDGSYVIKAVFRDNPDTRDFYQFFTRIKGVNEEFLPSTLGSIDDASLPDGWGETEYPVLQPMPEIGTSLEYTYKSGDEVYVKFCTVTEDTFLYYKDLGDIRNFSRNPLFAVNYNLHSNVHGGIGIWAGYGASFYKVLVP